MTRLSATAVPERARLIAARDRLHYLHTAARRVTPGMTAFEAYCAGTAWPSPPFRVAFWIRDRISNMFGVQSIGGFAGARPGAVPGVGERLDFFTVEASADDQLVLTARDTHLAVMISIDMTSSTCAPGARWCHITASVETFNRFGRLYMIPVGPAHRLIVWKMLRAMAGGRAA